MSPIIILLIGMIIVLCGILVIRLHTVLVLILGALVAGLLTRRDLLLQYATGKKFSPDQLTFFLNQSIGERVANGFGNTCAKIGLLIVFASIIGKCMLDSGAAERIVRGLLKVSSDKKAPVSFMISGFTEKQTIRNSSILMLIMGITGLLTLCCLRNYSR